LGHLDRLIYRTSLIAAPEGVGTFRGMALNWRGLRWLELPRGDYAVVGSGVLELHGIREANDTEVVVRDRLCKQLAGHPDAVMVVHSTGLEYLRLCTPYGEVHVNRASSFVSATFPGLSRVLESATDSDGIAIIDLRLMRNWKAAVARPKDLADVPRIDAYLARPRTVD
jgi:hypothetical protein